MPRTPIGSFIASARPRNGGLVHGALVFVGPGGEGEQALDGGVDLGRRLGLALAPVSSRRRSANSSRAGVEVLGEVVEDLRAVVRGGRAPSPARLARRLDGVADVLAVALADFADELAVRRRRPARE